MTTEKRTPMRLTSRILDGLEDAVGELEMQMECGWEGTPYECRSDDENCKCERCIERDRLEDAVMWLRGFVNRRKSP